MPTLVRDKLRMFSAHLLHRLAICWLEKHGQQ